MQSEIGLTLADAKVDVQTVEILDCGENLRIGAGTGTKVNDAPGEIAAKLRGVGVITVEERDSVWGKRFNELKLCASDAGLAIGEVLNVRGADVGDDAPIGRGDSSERGNFAGVIHSHFDYGEFVLRH